MFHKGDCEGCSEVPTIFLTQIVNGELRTYNLCRDCPHMDRVDDPAGCALAEMLLKLSDKVAGAGASGGESAEDGLDDAAEEYFDEDAEAEPDELETSEKGPEPVRGMRDHPQKSSRACRCGMTLAEFETHHRLGCPACYTTFQTEVMAVLKCSQKRGCRHQGKVPPGQRQGLTLQRESLEQELNEAVRAEDFERAARIRDIMRQLK